MDNEYTSLESIEVLTNEQVLAKELSDKEVNKILKATGGLDRQWYKKILKPFDNFPIQKEIFTDNSRFRVVVATRRGGKSAVGLESILHHAYNTNEAKAWIVGPNRGKVKKLYWIPLISRIKFLQKQGMNIQFAKMPMVSELTIYIYNKFGTVSEICFKSAENCQQLVGESITFVLFEEFNSKYIYDIENIWDVYVSPALLDANGKALIISTPNGFDTLHRLWEYGQPGSKKLDDWKSWKYTIYDVPFYTAEMIQALKQATSPEKFEQEYLVEFKTNTGKVYKPFHRQVHLQKRELLPNEDLYLTYDFNVDPMTTSICQVVKGDKEKNEQDAVLNVLYSFNTRDTNVKSHTMELIQFIHKLGWNKEKDVFIYGDFTGYARNVQSSSPGMSSWTIVENIFQNYNFNYYLEMPDWNPPAEDRIEAVNWKLLNADNQIGMYLDPDNCIPLIDDFEKVMRGKGNNSKREDKRKMELQGLNHNAENIGYLIHLRFPAESNQDFAIGSL